MSKRPYFIVYVLAIYVLFQFAWWTYLLFDLSSEVAMLSGTTDGAIDPSIEERQLMILGEGLVFLLILGLGAYYIIRNVRRELRIARLQRNFLLAVSHELRSPIATMKIYLQTLQKRELDHEKKNNILNDLLANTDRLSDLTDNIMTALRIEDDSLELQISSSELSGITEETIAGLQRTIAADHSIDLDIQNNATARVDPEAYKSILINLFENAVKYSESGSTIKVSLTSQESGTTLEVHDEGIGIARQEQQLIFDRFYRSGREETRKATGTGLGLYIVRSLCEAMNGRIELTSTPGKGSTFAAIFQK